MAETISMPTDFNIRVYPVNCALKTHSHDFLELAYIRHGWAQHTLNGNTRKLAEGDFVLVDFGEEHSYDVVGGNLEVINCLFRPSAIDASLGHCRSFGELLDSGLIGIGYAYGGLAGWEKVFRDEDGAVRRILDRMLAEMERQEIGFYPMIRALLAELIIGAMRMIRQRAPQTAGTEVQWMMEEIRRDPAAPHFLEEYAARFHMRPEALSRLFVSQAGELFSRMLARQRMQLACRLLLETRAPIPEIAERCGYQDGKSFRETFRRFTGISPREYRKQREAEFLANKSLFL